MKELVYGQSFLPVVERCSDQVGFVDGDVSRTYGEHLERVAALTHAMRTELGIAPHDRFAVMALNSHAYLELYHAAFLGAGVINPLNLRLAPKELAFILADSGTKVCFTDAFFADDDRRRCARKSGIEQVVLIGAGDVPHDVDVRGAPARPRRPTIPDEPEEDDPVVLMYTGGTTGLPKGVLLDHRAEMLNLYHVALGVAVRRPSEVYLHQTPMFHAASMGGIARRARRAAASRCSCPLFDPAAVLDAIERTR